MENIEQDDKNDKKKTGMERSYVTTEYFVATGEAQHFNRNKPISKAKITSVEVVPPYILEV